MKVLITGASGVIGKALLERLQNSCDLVICQSRVDKESKGNVKWIKNNLISDEWSTLLDYNVDIVYYLAAQTSVNNSKEDPINDLKVNVIGLINLIEFYRNSKAPPFFVYAGTVTQVGLTKGVLINEKIKDNPITYYDISKLSAEMYLLQYCREKIIQGCSLRLSNVYGKTSERQRKDRGVLDKIYNQALTCNSVKIYGDGNSVRDYIYIDDVIDAFIKASQNQDKTNGKYFTIGSGEGITLKDAFTKVANIAAAKVGKKVLITECKKSHVSTIDERDCIIDYGSFKSATGWKPKYNFERGILKAYMN